MLICDQRIVSHFRVVVSCAIGSFSLVKWPSRVTEC